MPSFQLHAAGLNRVFDLPVREDYHSRQNSGATPTEEPYNHLLPIATKKTSSYQICFSARNQRVIFFVEINNEVSFVAVLDGVLVELTRFEDSLQVVEMRVHLL